jgi:hypothetical protein
MDSTSICENHTCGCSTMSSYRYTSLYLTSITRVASSAFKASSKAFVISLTLSTPKRTTRISSCGASGVPPALLSTHSSRWALIVNVRVPVAMEDSRCDGSRTRFVLEKTRGQNMRGGRTVERSRLTHLSKRMSHTAVCGG